MSCNVYLTLSFASDTRSSRVLRSASVTKSTSRSKPVRLAPGGRQHTNNRPQIELQAHPQLEPTDHTADLMPDIPPKADYDSFLEVAVQAAQAAGQLIEQAFTKDKDVEFKGTMDLVTATDKQCEETILAAITDAFPDHKFIGEEGSSAQGFTSSLSDNPTW